MFSGFFKFSLFRNDEQGNVPGRDAVAEGCVFSSGKVAVAWLTGNHHITVYESLDDARKEICSEGTTKIVPADLEFTR